MAITIITGPYALCGTREQVPLRVVGDAAEYGNPDYELRVEVQKLNSALAYETFAEHIMPMNQLGIAEIDLRSSIAELVEPEPPFWPAISNNPVEHPAHTATFQYLVSEYLDGALLSSKGSPSPRFVHLGGTGHFQDTHIQGWRDQGKFLTHHPRTKKVAANQPDWLAIIAKDAYPTLEVNIVWRKEGGQTGTKTNTVSGQSNRLILIPTGIPQLGLGSNLESWTVTVHQPGGAAISESFTYEKDPVCYEWERLFLFLNSLGGYESARLTGAAQTSFAKRSNTVSRHVLGADYRRQRSAATRLSRYTEITEIGVGYRPADQVMWLRDLLLSEDVYRFGASHAPRGATDLLIPIVIDAQEIPVRNDTEPIEPFTITYSDAFDQFAL